MLHISNDNSCTPTQNSDRLAHAFLQILSEEAQRLSEVDLELSTGDDAGVVDPVDTLLGVDAHALPPERSGPRADMCAMAIMLAREIERTPGLLATLRHRSPRVCIKVARQEDVELAVELLKQCVFAGRSGVVNPQMRSRHNGYMIFGSSVLTPDRVRPWVADAASRTASPLVLVSGDPEVEFAPTILRGISQTLTLAKIDTACLNLVIEAVTGQPSDIPLDPQILAKIDFSDCEFAILPERSPVECRDALIAEVRSRIPPATGSMIEDLHGYGAAKAWGLEVVTDIQAFKDGRLCWEDFSNRALLLSGPPGSGKTTFAAALARSAEVPLIASSVADWNAAKNLSGTLLAMRSTFESARQAAPCVLLIDEFDGISKRARLSGEYVEYWQQIVNLLLELLDGTEQNEGVIVIGATNYPDMIDPALLRSGRIDRRIDIPVPGIADLAAIFGFYLGEQFDRSRLMAFAKAAIGRTGADCEVFVRRARAAARRGTRPLSATDILNAIGHDSAAVSAEVRRRVAVHEAGHAVVALVLGFAPVESLSINGGIGHAKFGAINPVYTAQSGKDHMAVAMAGRAAEELVLGTIGAGGGGETSSDLAVATRIAVAMELQFGLGELGLPYMETDLSTAAAVPGLLSTVRRHLDDAMERASSVLIEHRGLLDRLSSELFRTGVLLEEDIQNIVSACRSRFRLN